LTLKSFEQIYLIKNSKELFDIVFWNHFLQPFQHHRQELVEVQRAIAYEGAMYGWRRRRAIGGAKLHVKTAKILSVIRAKYKCNS